MSSYERNLESGCCTDWESLGWRGGADPAGSSQIEPENSDAREIHTLKAKNETLEQQIELLKKQVAELNGREQGWTERLDILQAVANGKNADGEKVMNEMGAEMIQLKKRLKKKTTELLIVKKDAKERNDRKETSIKRLEEMVAELRRLNEDANQKVTRKAQSISKLEEKVVELDRQVQATATMAEMRRLLQEKITEIGILEADNQRIASKANKVDDLEAKMGILNRALQDKIARLSDLEVTVQNQRSIWKGTGTEQSDTTVTELNRRLQEEMAKVSEMKVAARRKEEDARALEAKVAELDQRLRGETEASRWKGKGVEQSDEAVTQLKQRLQEEMEKVCTMEEAVRGKEKERKGLEAKVAELGQRLRRKERDMEHLETQKVETEGHLHEKTVKLSNLDDIVRQNSRKENDTGLLEKRVGELEQRLQKKTEKLSDMEEIVRRNSKKEKDAGPLEARVRELEQRLQEKTAEVARQNSRKERESKRLETKVAELELLLQEKTVKLSSLEKDARRPEQKNRDLSAANQKQSDEINQLKAFVKTAGEQASSPPSQARISKDNTFAVEVADLIRILNTQIEYASCIITDSISNQEPPSSSEASAALNELRDYLGHWLFNNLRRRSHQPETGYDPLITQIALQTVLVRICNRIINHWNPPFWNDDSICFRISSNLNTEGLGHVVAGSAWSALAPSYTTMSQSKIQEANIKYLSEILVKLITAAGGSLQKGKTLPSEYQEKVEDIAKRALELHQIVRKDVISMDIATYTVSSNTQFDPSQMDDTEGTAYKADPQDSVICTLEMGLRYRKRAELGKQGGYGEEYGVILKPRVVLSTTLEV